MTRALVLCLFAGTALAACAAEPEAADTETMGDAPMADVNVPDPAMQSATAELRDTQGNVVGTATVTGSDGALLVKVAVEGLPAGTHGAHIHTTGDCSATDFASAGGHWNPGTPIMARTASRPTRMPAILVIWKSPGRHRDNFQHFHGQLGRSAGR